MEKKGRQEEFLGFPCGSAGEESACSAGDLGSIPGLGISPGGGKGHPLQYSGLENSMDSIVHGVAKSRTRLRAFHFHFHGGCRGPILPMVSNHWDGLSTSDAFGQESMSEVTDARKTLVPLSFLSSY